MRGEHKLRAHAAGVALASSYIHPALSPLCSEKDHTSVSVLSVIPCGLCMIFSQIAYAWIRPLNSK